MPSQSHSSANSAAGVGLDGVLDHLVDPLATISCRSSPSRISRRVGVDLLALLVQHVVVLDHVLADDEVELLDLLLGALDALRQHLGLDRLAVGRPEGLSRIL